MGGKLKNLLKLVMCRKCVDDVTLLILNIVVTATTGVKLRKRANIYRCCVKHIYIYRMKLVEIVVTFRFSEICNWNNHPDRVCHDDKQ